MENIRRITSLNDLTFIDAPGQPLGKGSFAQVQKVIHNQSGRILALKEIDMSNTAHGCSQKQVFSNFDSAINNLARNQNPPFPSPPKHNPAARLF